jgi:PAS domain S-box-containing protein
VQIRAQLIELAHDAIIVCDSSSSIIFWNRGAEELYGWTSQEAIGQVTHSLLQTRFPMGRETVEALLITGQQWEGELVHTCKDGRQVIVESRQVLTRNIRNQPTAILEINRDITERKQRERENQEQYRTIVQTANEGIWLINTQAQTLYINERMADMLGYTAEEMVGRAVAEFVFPEDMPKAQERIGKNLQGTFEQFDFRFRRKDGRPLDVLASTSPAHDGKGGISGALGMFTDLTERRQAEVDQLRLAAIVESSDDAIISKTLNGIITSWNFAAERMFGYSSQEAVGKHITLIIPAELQEEEETILAKLRKGEHIDHFETVRMRKDGTRINISLSISPIKNSAGQIIGASKIARDITESKRLQQNLQFLYDASKVLSSSFDYKTTLQTIANLAVPRIADWCTIDMLAENGSIEPLVIAHMDTQKVQWARELRKKYPMKMDATHGVPQVLRTGVPEFVPFIDDDILVAAAVDDEQLALLRNIGFTSGMTIPLIIAGKAIGTVTFALAESARRYTQADLTMAEELASRASLAIQNAQLYQEVQQSRDQLDIILRGVADGIIVYDIHSHIIYANEAAAQLTGSASVETVIETSATGIAARYEIIDEQRQPFPRSQFTHLRVLAGEREAEAVMGYKYRGTGQLERWSLVKSRPILNELGEVTMVVTIIHDITERVVAEQRKDEFISMTSHELKTPVTSLKGFTHVLQRRLEKQGDQQALHYLSRMDAQLNKLTKLITELLDISRMQTGKLAFQMEPFNLDNLIDEIVENVQATTTMHSIIIEGKTDAQIMGDRDRLGQVFINLLSNALKYSPHADKVMVRLLREQKQAIVSVQDFGIGIDQAHHQKIFERFYQVTDAEERTYPGLGIGLYIASEIMTRHGGRIWVESTKGKGSTFFISLPLIQETKETSSSKKGYERV